MQETHYRLDYKPEKGQWHFDNGTHEANTHGWETIADWEPDSKLTKFTNYMSKFYGDALYPTAKGACLSTSFVQTEWQKFSYLFDQLKGVGD